MTPRRARRARRALIAGGILGIALAPGAARGGRLLRARVDRARTAADDPVSAFCVAPCYEHDRVTGAGFAERSEAVK